jgi:hypothetical protein
MTTFSTLARSESIAPLAKFMDSVVGHPEAVKVFGERPEHQWLFAVESSFGTPLPRAVITPTSLTGGRVTIYAGTFEGLYEVLDIFKAAGAFPDEGFHFDIETFAEPGGERVFKMTFGVTFP